MAKEMVVSPVMLEGVHVRLEPLAKAHLAGLAEVGLDEELWRWIPVPIRTVDDMAAYLETALGNKNEECHCLSQSLKRPQAAPSGAPVTAISTARIIAWRLAGRG